jgi:meromycolic acid enoyl-[acyl-carrier-protein] reductase
VILQGKRVLVTGVLTNKSIGFSVAEQSQLAGAEVVLTSFGRPRRLTERAARQLPRPTEVLELDVTKDEDLEALAATLAERWDGLDGLVHSIAFAPRDAIGGGFMTTPADSAAIAFTVSAYSLKALTQALLPLLERSGGSVLGLDFDATVAWPNYDWMGVAKAALESTCRYLAMYLGSLGVRVNLIAAGPLATVASQAIGDFAETARLWPAQAPLGWDLSDPTPVGQAAVMMLSDLSRAITGQVLHVDGGAHAVGAPLDTVRIAAGHGEAPDGATGAVERVASMEGVPR